MKKLNSESKNNIKLIVITSLIWVVIGAVAVGVVKYGEYQRAAGMLEGFEKARDILSQK